MKVEISQNVAILVDGNNIEFSVREHFDQNAMVSYDDLVPKLVGRRSLNRLKYFREGKNISKKLADRLHRSFYGVTIPCHKSADIPLAIEAAQLADKVDTIIIMSGDADYVDLVNHLKSKGVRVEICSVKETTSPYLLKVADHFTFLDKDSIFINKKITRI